MQPDIDQQYQQILSYLYELLPMFSRQGAAAIKKDLTNTVRFCEALGNPQEKFKSIHVAGTNGKGSVCHMMAASLQEAGYKVGLYTSPHLIDFRERIRINGITITKQWVVDFVEKYREQIEDIAPSFFEITVAMAFLSFAEQEIDVAIIETGLGGRLDSTNIITPLVSVITSIGYDHMDMLGDTIAQIATEKAGIIKPKVPVIISEQNPETETVFFEQAFHKQSTVYYADAMWDTVRTGTDLQHQRYKAVNRARHEMHDVSIDLLGDYQSINLKTVLTIREVMVSSGMIDLPFDVMVRALSKVKKLTGFRGRWDVLQTEPLIVADVAHNAAGLEGVLKQWENVEAEKKHVVLGFVKDKDVPKALELFSKDNIYYFCNADLPRAMPASHLKQLAEAAGLQGTLFASVADAVKAARETLGKNDALLITGSVFVVGEAIDYLNVNNGLLFPTSLEEQV